MDEETIRKIREASTDSVCEGECSNPECEHTQDVEPDGDYPCPECGEGRIQSILIKMGMI